jgi:drug/metabolite transporter (DMT)-like permease
LTSQSRAITGYFLVLAATAIWSGNFIVARGLSNSIPPVTLAFLRWATATIVLMPFAIRSLCREIKIVRKHLGYLSLTALLGVTVFNPLVYIAAHTSNALNLSLISVCSPAFIVVFARIFLQDPFTFRRLTGTIVATSGVVLLITDGKFQRLVNLTFSQGDLWMVFGAAIFALYSILAKVKPRELSIIVFLVSTFSLGVLFMLPWLVWEWTQTAYVIDLSSTVVVAIVYLGVGPSLLAFLFWNQAIAIIGPVRAAFVYYCLPLFSGVEALLLLNEGVHAVHALSGVLILTGVIVATRE